MAALAMYDHGLLASLVAGVMDPFIHYLLTYLLTYCETLTGLPACEGSK